MTMLTPLGAGGAAHRTRRRWPRGLAVLLVLTLVAGAAAAWWWYRDRQETDALPGPVASRTCTTPTPDLPKKLPAPDQVVVDVANGTDRAGLALDTADALATRGFVIGDIGNTDRPVTRGVALVRYRDRDLAAAVVVASYVPGAVLRPVASAGEVSLWLGPDFVEIAGSEDADPSTVVIPPGEPRCRTVD